MFAILHASELINTSPARARKKEKNETKKAEIT